MKTTVILTKELATNLRDQLAKYISFRTTFNSGTPGSWEARNEKLQNMLLELDKKLSV